MLFSNSNKLHTLVSCRLQCHFHATNHRCYKPVKHLESTYQNRNTLSCTSDNEGRIKLGLVQLQTVWKELSNHTFSLKVSFSSKIVKIGGLYAEEFLPLILNSHFKVKQVTYQLEAIYTLIAMTWVSASCEQLELFNNWKWLQNLLSWCWNYRMRLGI